MTSRITSPYAAPLAVGVAAAVALTGCSGNHQSSADSRVVPAGSASAAPTAGASAAPSGPARAGSAPMTLAPRKLVRKATISSEVADLAAAEAQVRSATAAAGGLVSGEELEESQSAGTSASSHLTVQVPVDRFDAALGALSRIGTVRSRGISTEDVTGAVADAESRVKTLRASVDRTRALMARATSISDITALEGELSRRESDLESLQAQQRTLAAQTAMSTIELHLTRVASSESSAEDRGQTGFGAGWEAGVITMHHVLVAGAAALGFLLPLAVPLLLVGAGVWALMRRSRRRRAHVSPAHETAPGPDRR